MIFIETQLKAGIKMSQSGCFPFNGVRSHPSPPPSQRRLIFVTEYLNGQGNQPRRASKGAPMRGARFVNFFCKRSTFFFLPICKQKGIREWSEYPEKQFTLYQQPVSRAAVRDKKRGSAHPSRLSPAQSSRSGQSDPRHRDWQ